MLLDDVIDAETITKIGGGLRDRDDDQFKNELEGTIYDILEPEIHIKDVDDVYINSLFHVTHFDGERIQPQWSYTSIDPDVFFI